MGIVIDKEEAELSHKGDNLSGPEHSKIIKSPSLMELKIDFDDIQEVLGGETSKPNDVFGVEFIKSHGHFSNEKWEVNQTFHGRICDINENVVSVDVYISEDDGGNFQCREFDSLLFKNLELSEKDLVIIKIQARAGESRIRTYPGKGIVDASIFSLEDQWNALGQIGGDERLKVW